MACLARHPSLDVKALLLNGVVIYLWFRVLVRVSRIYFSSSWCWLILGLYHVYICNRKGTGTVFPLGMNTYLEVKSQDWANSTSQVLVKLQTLCTLNLPSQSVITSLVSLSYTLYLSYLMPILSRTKLIVAVKSGQVEELWDMWTHVLQQSGCPWCAVIPKLLIYVLFPLDYLHFALKS